MQIVSLGNNKKHTIILLSAKFAQWMVKVIHYDSLLTHFSHEIPQTA